MIQLMYRIFGLAGLAAALAALASPAIAGPTLTFNLNQISDSGIGAGSIGTVTLTQVQNSTTAVDVKVAISPYMIINSGGPHTPFAFDLNGNLSGMNVSFVTPTGGSYGAGAFSYDSSGGSENPYGAFNQAIDYSARNGSVNGYAGVLEFVVTRALGLSTTDFIGNSLGYYFAADVSNGTTTGGVASNGPTTAAIAEPASMAVLGAGLIGLCIVYRRRRAVIG